MDQSPKVLLVEGQDDQHVVGHLLSRTSSASSFDIQNKEGIENLIEAISTEIKAPGRAVIGIVADANDNPDARWAAVSSRLRKAEIEVPKALPPGGTIVEGLPRVGVWLMPDNQRSGELEDFVQEMIPPDDPVWPQAQRYIEDIPEEARKFRAKKKSRAELHAWLATREEPGLMGSAIGRRDLQTDGPLCSAFLAWIERLFG